KSGRSPGSRPPSDFLQPRRAIRVIPPPTHSIPMKLPSILAFVSRVSAIAIAAAAIASSRADSGLGLEPSSRDRVVNLRGKWRFSVGDDARWASPVFDDAKWSEVDAPDA